MSTLRAVAGVPCDSIAETPGMKFEKTDHNFGSIAEEKGPVYYAFRFVNDGSAPLVITRVTADCGCTTPDWPEQAIRPGQSSKIGVAYNPAGRPGAFVKHIHVYSNASESPTTLSIKGAVSTLGGGADGLYAAKIGPLELSKKRLLFPPVSIGTDAEMRVLMNNPTKDSLRVAVVSLPRFVIADTTTQVLLPGEPIEYVLSLSTDKRLSPGIYSEPLTISVAWPSGEVYRGSIDIDAVLADDFSQYQGDYTNAPVMQLRTYFDLETVPPTSKPIDVVIDLHNAGKELLVIQTIQSVEPSVEVKNSNIPLKIAPERDGKIRLRVHPKVIAQEGKSEISTNVSILCNDPGAPLRRVKIKLGISRESDKQ